jgi:hypothetical protein
MASHHHGLSLEHVAEHDSDSQLGHCMQRMPKARVGYDAVAHWCGSTVAALVVTVYNHLLSFNDEVEHVWL